MNWTGCLVIFRINILLVKPIKITQLRKNTCFKRFPMFGNIHISRINATKGYHTFRLALHKGQRLLSQYNDCGSTPHRLCVASCKLHYFRNRLEIRPNDSVAMNLADLKCSAYPGYVSCSSLAVVEYFFYNRITNLFTIVLCV